MGDLNVERARRDALEEAARECDAGARRINATILDGGSPVRSVIIAGTVAICQRLADNIRALAASDRTPGIEGGKGER